MIKQIILLQKEFHGEYVQVYYNSPTGHIGMCSRYIDKQKEYKRQKEYRQTEKGKQAMRKGERKYRQTKKGRKSIRKAKKKSNAKRRQNLQWIQMFENPFDELELVDYHHITDVYVIAIPRDLHKLYGGKYHREKVMEIVKQIYLEQRDVKLER